MVNTVILSGNLGKDAEIKQLDGFSVAEFNLAVQDSKKVGEEWQNNSIWISIKMFNPSEYLMKNLKRGANVLVQGKYQINTYEKEDKKISYHYILASKIDCIRKISQEEPQRVDIKDYTDEEAPF